MRGQHTHGRARFSLARRAASFVHAARGVRIFLASTHNAWIHLALLAMAILLGFYLRISTGEWLALILAAGLVLCAEAINTAIELAVDLASPNLHPLARNAKDVAAGAVLIAAITAAATGAVIFLPRLLGST